MIDKLLEGAIEMGASDVHLNTKNPPVFRIDGLIKRIKGENLTPEQLEGFAKKLLGEKEYKRLIDGEDIDLAYSNSQGRYRVNAFRQLGNVAIAIRLLRGTIPTLEELNFPQIFYDLAELPRGIVLVTGPTGSGKSTTLAAMINQINKDKSKHILTLEDPIEYIHEQKKSIVTQREIYKDTQSFSTALKSALREDPDIILVGEMRDPETIQLALSAAETGHLVFSTLHTIGAPDTVNRIIDAFPSNQQDQVRSQLSTALKGVISQVLLPKLDGGRIAAHEILVSSDAVSNLIRQNKVNLIRSTMLSGGGLGMQVLDKKLAELVQKKMIAESVGFELAKDKDEFSRFIRR